MNKEYRSFASQLAEALTLKNMKQSDLANHLGIHKQQVYRWLNTDIVPRDEMLQKISTYLEYSFDILPRELANVPREYRTEQLLGLSEDELKAVLKVFSARESYLKALDKLFFVDVSEEATKILIPEIDSMKLRLDSIGKDFEKKIK
ncbi:helix-turn-helix transcriptional regulator [Lactococcus garvieae]